MKSINLYVFVKEVWDKIGKGIFLKYMYERNF